MKKQTKSNWQKHLVFAAITSFVLMFAGNLSAQAQVKYKTGDRVECDSTGTGKWWTKGTVLPFQKGDFGTGEPDGSWYRVKADSTGGELYCTAAFTRPITAAKTDKHAGQPQENDERTTENENEPGAKFKPGDRIECDGSGINNWVKGTVLPFQEKDNPGAEKDKTGKYFDIHRVLEDRDASTRPQGGFCFTDRMRPLAGGAPMEIPKTAVPIGKVTVDEDNTLSADRPIMDCPVEQPKVKNGARPNAELLKKITRCDKGEKSSSKGYDGAVTVDVTDLQIAAPRQWIYSRDIGGKPGTTIYPVRVTYTVKTFYRNRTVVDENWVRTINFYVNDFGEWQSGSEEPVKSPQSKDIPRLP